MYVIVFMVVTAFLVLRGRLKRRARPATAKDVMAAALTQGEFPGYDVRPHRRDPITGQRDWGQ